MSVDSVGTWTLARPQLVVFIDDRAILPFSFLSFFSLHDYPLCIQPCDPRCLNINITPISNLCLWIGAPLFDDGCLTCGLSGYVTK